VISLNVKDILAPPVSFYKILFPIGKGLKGNMGSSLKGCLGVKAKGDGDLSRIMTG
jgi:hypothetical protein